jgi:hypothetical protein
MIQRILALVAGFLVVATIGGWGHEQRPTTPGQPQAARALRAVMNGEPAAANLLPVDFRTVTGYWPAVVPAGPTKPRGGCSSPFGGTGYHFSPACRQHDLGYDLLRYADVKGRPLGPWARKAVDDRFARQIWARCHDLGCRVMAGLYTGIVRFNSWRQGYGTPVAEPVGKLALPVAAGLVAALLFGLLPQPRRRDRPSIGRSAGGTLTGQPA